MGERPVVSFVVPARDEAAFLGATLASIDRLRTERPIETVVVDGDSDDATPDIARRYGARVVGGGASVGRDRHRGAERARGRWLAFIDADTTVQPAYVSAMRSFVADHGLHGAASRCRVRGGWRAQLYEWLFNRVILQLSPPIMPGFHVFVRRDAYFDVGGFEAGPNEDVTFSRRFGRAHPVGVCPRALVETSGRRLKRDGLLRTTAYYTRKEWRRQIRRSCEAGCWSGRAGAVKA